MSFYPDSYQNQTGLGYVPPKADEPMSNIQVMVHEREGAQPEQFHLTQAQEDFAQKVAKTGVWAEMPHSSGRRQIRQRVLDILMEKTRAGGSVTNVTNVTNVASKPKSKTEYVYVLVRHYEDGVTDVVAAPRRVSEAKGSVDGVTWTTVTKDKFFQSSEVVANSGRRFNYTITRTTVPKPKA